MLQYKVAPLIKTDRLTIRIVDSNDCYDFFEFCSDPKVCTYLTFNPYKSVTYTKWILENMQNAYIHGTDVNFSVVLNTNKKVIGSVSLHFFENENSAELGYLFNCSYWNNGYCKEAVNALINVAFDYYGVNCIYASYIVGNNASKTILKKIGFDECGYQKDKIKKNKISFDVVNLKLLKNK